MKVRVVLIILTGFAFAWAWAALRLSGTSNAWLVLPAILSIALLVWGWTGPARFESGGTNVGRTVSLWSAVEFLALIIAANALQLVHRSDLLFPVSSLIVGLHFIPLAHQLPARLYYATAGGFLIAAVLGLLAPPTDRPLVVGLAAAITLWATATVIIVRLRETGVAERSFVTQG